VGVPGSIQGGGTWKVATEKKLHSLAVAKTVKITKKIGRGGTLWRTKKVKTKALGGRVLFNSRKGKKIWALRNPGDGYGTRRIQIGKNKQSRSEIGKMLLPFSVSGSLRG